LDRFNIYVGQRKNWLPPPEDIKTEKEREEAEKIYAEICESDIPYQVILSTLSFNANQALLLGQGKSA